MNTEAIYKYTFWKLLNFVKESRDLKSKYYQSKKKHLAPVIDLGDEDFALYQDLVESNTIAVNSAIVEMVKKLIETFSSDNKEFEMRFQGREFYVRQFLI